MASYPFCDWPHTWYHDIHLASQDTKARHDNSPNSEGFLSDAQIRNTIFKPHAFCLDCVAAVMIWGEKGTRWCSLMSLLAVLLTAHNLPLLDLSLSPAFPPLLLSPHPIPFLFSLPFSLLSHLVLLLSSPPFPLPPSLPLPFSALPSPSFTFPFFVLPPVFVLLLYEPKCVAPAAVTHRSQVWFHYFGHTAHFLPSTSINQAWIVLKGTFMQLEFGRCWSISLPAFSTVSPDINQLIWGSILHLPYEGVYFHAQEGCSP